MMRSEYDRKVRIFKLPNQMGVPTSIRGREYIETGILLLMKDEVMFYKITGRLYPAIARQHGATAAQVERGIRTAIELAFDRGSIDTLGSIFGNTISSIKGKPTNREFLTMTARWLLLQEEEDNDK